MGNGTATTTTTTILVSWGRNGKWHSYLASGSARLLLGDKWEMALLLLGGKWEMALLLGDKWEMASQQACWLRKDWPGCRALA